MQVLPQMGAGGKKKKKKMRIICICVNLPSQSKGYSNYQTLFLRSGCITSFAHSILSKLLVSMQLLFFSHIHRREATFYTLLKSTKMKYCTKSQMQAQTE